MHFQRIDELSRRIHAREITSLEVTELTLDRIRRYDGTLRSYSEVFFTDALQEAALRDRELAEGLDRGTLHGIPIAVKDLFSVEGTSPNAGGIMFDDIIASQDAIVVERLRAAGAVLIGKLQMSEGALAAHHPTVRCPVNPWNEQSWVGASSSGNAVATSAGLCFASVGTDTGGSIRFPSAATGLTGLKPTWGRIPQTGSIEFAGSLDHIGPMARSVHDCAIIYDAIADIQPINADSMELNMDLLVDACERVLKPGLRIGVDANFMSICDDATTYVIQQAISVFRDLGVEVVTVSLPNVDQIVQDWTPSCAVEAAVVHEAAFTRRSHDYGPQLRELIEVGLAMPATDFQKMLRRRQQFAQEFRQAVHEVDALLLQVTGIAAPTAEYLEEIGVGVEWSEVIMKATCPINAAGVPSLTLPGGFTSEGLPVGFQLVGKDWQESTLMSLGNAFQAVTTHHDVHPPNFL